MIPRPRIILLVMVLGSVADIGLAAFAQDPDAVPGWRENRTAQEEQR